MERTAAKSSMLFAAALSDIRRKPPANCGRLSSPSAVCGSPHRQAFARQTVFGGKPDRMALPVGDCRQKKEVRAEKGIVIFFYDFLDKA